MTPLFIAQIVLTLFVFFMLLNSAAVMVYVERKVAAMLQQRVGPYLVGPKGMLQPLADVVKLMFKEELRPKAADAFLFALAPIISATCAFAAFAVVPFGADTRLFGLLDEPLRLQVADVNVAVLVIFAIASMSVYGIVLAGWSSNSKYSLLGGLRSSAQMISYELSYGLALASVLLIGNSLSLSDIVNRQAGTWLSIVPRWFIFVQPVGFVIYMLAGIAETNRAPFDFPEAEQELVAGYHTEYSSMSFAMFFLAEYINMVTVSAVATDLFLGGWHGPFLPESLGWIWFLVKVGAILFFYVWMRWTLPRYRYDQLMTFGWKVLLPLAVVNLLATAAAVLYFTRHGPAEAGHYFMILFYAFAAVAVGASLLVIAQRNPIYSVLLLIASFGALSGLYVMLDAPFVAVIQIVVYAGAIMVLFLFVVMLLNAPHEDTEADERRHILLRAGPLRFGAFLAVVLASELGWALTRGGDSGAFAGGSTSSVAAIGRSLFTDYAFAFEVTSGIDPRGDGRRRRAGPPRKGIDRKTGTCRPSTTTCFCRRCSSPSARPASSCGETSSRFCCRSKSC